MKLEVPLSTAEGWGLLSFTKVKRHFVRSSRVVIVRLRQKKLWITFDLQQAIQHVHIFLRDILGKNWSDYAPESWKQLSGWMGGDTTSTD